MENNPNPIHTNGIGTEAPASWTVKYIKEGFDCMLTLRAESGSALMPLTEKALDWLTSRGAQAQRKYEAAPMVVAPAQPVAAQPPAPNEPEYVPVPAGGGEVAAEVIKVKALVHAVTDTGHHHLKVKGGKYSKFGVKAWEEVVPIPSWQNWPIGQEYAPPAGMEFAAVADNKVIEFRAHQ